MGQGNKLLSAAKEELVEAERQLLQQLHGVFEQATPQMEEMSMLTGPYANDQHNSKVGDCVIAGGNGLARLGQGNKLLSAAKEELVEAERQLLQQLHGLLEQATPQMEEMSMLTDAIKQLDELFLLVVVGEFNSGKSSVINALLGSR